MWTSVTVVSVAGFGGLVFAEVAGIAIEQLFEYIVLVLLLMMHLGQRR